MQDRGIGLPGGRRAVVMPEGSGLPRPKLGLPGREAGDKKGLPSRDATHGSLASNDNNASNGHGSSTGDAIVSEDSSAVGRVIPSGLPGRKVVSEPVEARDGLPSRSRMPGVPVGDSVESLPHESPQEAEGETVRGGEYRAPVSALPVRKTFEDSPLASQGRVTQPTVAPSVRLPVFNRAPVREDVSSSPMVPYGDVDASYVDSGSNANVVDNGNSVDRGLPAVTVPSDGVESTGGVVSHGGHRSPKRRVLEKSPLAGAERWDDDSVPDTHLGLTAEVIPPRPVKKRKAKFALTARDIEVITLCARYRFAYREQIQHYFQSENIRNRLTRLADEGLLRKDMVTQNQALWLPMQSGLDVADLDFSHIERGRYSATTIAHSVGLLNLGIEFEKGWENLLMEEQWPNFNRPGGVQGEVVITEREITNSFNRLKGIAKGDGKKSSDAPRELMQLRSEAMATGNGMESHAGMAGLFVGYYQNKSHTPDMVIARPRNADGSSNHIAVELELSAKPIPDWIRILRSFKNDPMFKSVVYFTHKRRINNELTEINRKHVGLTEDQFKIFKYTPRNDSIPFWG